MKNPSFSEQVNKIGLFFCELIKPWVEVANGLRSGTLPWTQCLTVSVALQLLILFGGDGYLFRYLSLEFLYPRGIFFPIYYASVILSPFFGWGIYQVGEKRKLTRRLTTVFESCGLRNRLGRLPNFVFDMPIDESIRKLRLTRAVLDLEDFRSAKGALEGALQVYIDEIRENREYGTVDIIYARESMPRIFRLESPTKIRAGKYLVGRTRSKPVSVSLTDVPHLLVAGQTGGGKSTFLRQFITTQYLNDKKAEFLLVDLKGGMEFQVFENLPRVTVPDSSNMVVRRIEELAEALDKRMAFLKSEKCKDIQQYFTKLKTEGSSTNSTAPTLNRHFVVVDEAAEMFLAGHHASGKEVQKAKRALSKVARQGRAVGMHLVVATQRPDSRALDPQIKANLTGALCFQMANDISSITVLGNGRATDLPSIAGRGIWKTGGEMIEVQTPLLESSEVEAILSSQYEQNDSATRKESPTSKTESTRPGGYSVNTRDGRTDG